MTNKNLELMEWGDGTIRLTYWDSLHGENESYILDADGQAYIEDEKDFRVSINLVEKLRKLIKKSNKSR